MFESSNRWSIMPLRLNRTRDLTNRGITGPHSIFQTGSLFPDLLQTTLLSPGIFGQLTDQICFLPNSNALERSILEKCTLKRSILVCIFFACAGENPYPPRNTPHLTCVNIIDYVTVSVVTAHCMACCVSAITSSRSAPPLTPTPCHTHKHTLWVVDWLSL